MGEFVYNADGTSNRKCQCTYKSSKTWLDHWVWLTPKNVKLPEKCTAKYCGNYVEVGAHVRSPDDMRTIWIIPFCQYHNKRPSSEAIELKDGVTMVGASVKIDCA